MQYVRLARRFAQRHLIVGWTSIDDLADFTGHRTKQMDFTARLEKGTLAFVIAYVAFDAYSADRPVLALMAAALLVLNVAWELKTNKA